MDKIKVCHIITKLELGGAQRVALYIISNLDKEKFVPVFITGKGGILDPEVAALKGVKIYFTTALIRQIRPLKDLLGFFRLLRILIKERPMVVHTHSSKAGILGRWAAFFAGVPVIMHTIHGFGFNEMQKGITKNVLVLAEKITALITDKLVVVTAEDKKKGLKFGIANEEKYVLIRAGIDTGLYRSVRTDKEKLKIELGIKGSEKVITTIGPFKPQKNLKDFIKLAKAVSSKRPQVKFIIVGDGEERRDIEALILALGLNDRVKLLGWRNDIAEILSITDIFVMTSLWEGLPRTIVEAMCVGIPVVANAVDGVREIVKDGETGFLVKPFEIDKMAEKVIVLLDDPKAAARLGQKGAMSISEEYDLKNMVGRYAKLYVDIIESKRQRLTTETEHLDEHKRI